MATGLVRVQVRLPKALVEEIDGRVGSGRRDEFIAGAVRRQLKDIEDRLRAFNEAIESLKDLDVPGWETHDSTVEWVRAQRRPTRRDHWDGDGEGDR